MEKRKELLNQIAQEIKKNKEQYKCLNLNDEEFNLILTKIIEKTTYLDNNELFILNVIEKLIKELNKKIKKLEFEEKKKIINNFINDNFEINDSPIESQNTISKILEFLKKTNFEINPDNIIELLKDNRIIEKSIKIIVEKNFSLIKANGIENVFTNNNLIYFIEIYCDINNINISREMEEIDIADKNFGIVKMYLRKIKNLPVLTREQETELFEREKQGDTKAREIIIKSNLKLVVSIAKNYVATGDEFLDLIQNGNLGLMKAIERFDYTKGFKFSSYATWWIRQTILREHQNKGRTVRLPVNIQEKMDRIKKYETEFEKLHQRKPTIKEISEELGISVERLNEIYAYQKEMISINVMIGENEDTEVEELISNEDVSTEETIEKKLLSEEVKKLFISAGLNEREKRIIMMRYGFFDEPMSLEEIGSLFNITRERVRQIETKALVKLRTSEEIKNLLVYMRNQAQSNENLDKYLTLIEIGPKNKNYASEDLDSEIKKYSEHAYYRYRKRK